MERKQPRATTNTTRAAAPHPAAAGPDDLPGAGTKSSRRNARAAGNAEKRRLRRRDWAATGPGAVTGAVHKEQPHHPCNKTDPERKPLESHASKNKNVGTERNASVGVNVTADTRRATLAGEKTRTASGNAGRPGLTRSKPITTTRPMEPRILTRHRVIPLQPHEANQHG